MPANWLLQQFCIRNKIEERKIISEVSQSHLLCFFPLIKKYFFTFSSIILKICSFVASLYLHHILLKIGDEIGTEFVRRTSIIDKC